MALVKCRECGNQVSTKAKGCPKCGALPPKKMSVLTWFVVVMIVLIVVILSMSDQPEPVAVENRKVDVATEPSAVPREKSGITDSEVASIVAAAMYNEETRALEFELTELVKVHARHPQCEELQGVGLSPSKSSPGQPVFFAQCKTPGGDFFNTDYTVTQILNRELQVVKSYSYDQSHEWCGRLIREKLNHPGTYDENVLDVDYEERAGGRSTMVIGFTAKNGFGVEMEYRAVCRFERGKQGSVMISQK